MHHSREAENDPAKAVRISYISPDIVIGLFPKKNMILQKLKEATRDQHDALESAVDVMNRSLALADYKEMLVKFYRFYSAVEPTLPAADLLANGFDIGPRQKLPFLVADLRHLGVLNGDEAEIEKWDDIPDLTDTARAFGGIYVMEGATLGGQVITRHLKEHLDITPETGGAFFNSYGKEVGPMWKEFGAAVTAFSEANGREDDTVQAARETFDAFRRCFEEGAKAEAGA
ncbi:MAG: biliverdin-producing heme oxygenase [Acidobacteria bacterium]|nr:biliverdin-producing heme oxygenase [Acidobacteriota bacterium]